MKAQWNPVFQSCVCIHHGCLIMKHRTKAELCTPGYRTQGMTGFTGCNSFLRGQLKAHQVKLNKKISKSCILQTLLIAENWHQENLGKLHFLLNALYETFSTTCKFPFVSPFIVRNTTGRNI